MNFYLSCNDYIYFEALKFVTIHPHIVFETRFSASFSDSFIPCLSADMFVLHLSTSVSLFLDEMLDDYSN